MNGSSVTREAGHDAPVSAREFDDYDRWPIASAISGVIADAPSEWSTRVGLYGRWGSGKTTVLNFLAIQQRAAGNVVIRYSPWGLSSESELWSDFGKQLRKGLSVNGISVGWWRTICFQAKEWKRQIGVVLKGGASAAQAALQVPVPKEVVEATASLIEKKFTISRKDIARISSELGARRVIVFIDDLDRADPVVIPKVLLALRELLDYPGFVFVLAFDRAVVTKSLGHHNPAWGNSGEIFIEKIVDFPFDLPPPSVSQIEALASRQFREQCPFVPLEAVREIQVLLPSNPRRLKLFVRLVASLQNEASRHAEYELDWLTILVFCLLKLESEEFSSELVRRICDADSINWMTWAFAANPTDEQNKVLVELLESFPDISQEIRSRITNIVLHWQSKRSLVQGERLRYQAYFALRPHNITWREFDDFFSGWRPGREPSKALSFVQERASAMDVPVYRVATEFIESVTNRYGALLENASEVKTEAEHKELVTEAFDCLLLFQQTFQGFDGSLKMSTGTVESWGRMVTVCAEWQHFTANPGETELRALEIQCLRECADQLECHSAAYDFLKPWDDHAYVFDERSDRLKKQFFEGLIKSLEPKVIDAAIQLFKVKGAIRPLISGDERLGFTYILGAPDSPLYQKENLEKFRGLISEEGSNPLVRQNALEYLNLLLGALEHAARFCTADERRAFIAEHAELVEQVWGVVVSARGQFRALHALRKQREALVKAGASDERLSRPDWLQVV